MAILLISLNELLINERTYNIILFLILNVQQISISTLFLIVVCLLFVPLSVSSQNDTITLKSGDKLAGEIKLIAKGVLKMETAYSDKDFMIEYNKVNKLSIQRKCVIILTDDRRRFGYVKSNANGKITITLDNNLQEEYSISEIIILQEVRDKFIQRFSAAIDFSYNFTKANKSNQVVISGKIKYNSQFWSLESNINTLNSNQENAEKTRRTDANAQFIRLLERKLFLVGEIAFLSNTEQALDSRYSPSLGLGKYVASTNKMYLGLSTGLALNIENYLDPSLDKNSTEVFVAAQLNLFDVKDFDLETDVKFYPSLSEKGRFRTDYNLSLKYNLPIDFYIKLGFMLNYDNKPAISGNDIDYIFTSGLGWAFN